MARLDNDDNFRVDVKHDGNNTASRYKIRDTKCGMQDSIMITAKPKKNALHVCFSCKIPKSE